ncbi:MAG: glycosyltransferase family 4 protein [Ignavibacteria bacterium]|nr:glycosyltransferase family 4 protein [Ignavibacteria bacterium]
MKFNILHITPDFNYACGRSYYVYLLMKYFQKKHRVHLISNGGDSFERLEERGITYSIIKGLKSKNPIKIASNIGQIRKYIREHDVNIVHTHHRLAELLGVQAAGYSGKNGPQTVFTSLSIVKRKYNIEFKSKHIIAVSNSIKDMLTKKFGISESKISVIPNFTDTNEIHELEVVLPYTRDHDRFFNILAVGRFHHEKNFETLLKALSLINDTSIKLILVGDGNRDIDYKKYIAKNNINVEIIVPQKNLLQYFMLADICVLPSERDPFPNFMLQAGLHKRAFIGANVDGIGELIRDEVNGLLFEAGNAAELAEKIKRLHGNPMLREKCAANLHWDVLNNYTEEFIVPKVEHLYRHILSTEHHKK